MQTLIDKYILNTPIKEINNFDVLSLDEDNNVVVFSDERKAINFDKVKDCYLNSLNERFKSTDCLMFLNTAITFVEFKNIKKLKWYTSSIVEKLKDTLTELITRDFKYHQYSASQFEKRIINYNGL